MKNWGKFILACAYIGYLLGFTAAIAYQSFKIFV